MTNANGTFNSFPMMSYDGRKLVFGSSRNGSAADGHSINLFLAEWTNAGGLKGGPGFWVLTLMLSTLALLHA